MKPENDEPEIIKEMILMAELEIEKQKSLIALFNSPELNLAAKFMGAAILCKNSDNSIKEKCPLYGEFQRNKKAPSS